jgi:hypothetical protein
MKETIVFVAIMGALLFFLHEKPIQFPVNTIEKPVIVEKQVIKEVDRPVIVEKEVIKEVPKYIDRVVTRVDYRP